MVEFPDRILVVDAPDNDRVSASVIAKIRKMIPEKPFAYLVTTHFHYDHIGGFVEYVKQGATAPAALVKRCEPAGRTGY